MEGIWRIYALSAGGLLVRRAAGQDTRSEPVFPPSDAFDASFHAVNTFHDFRHLKELFLQRPGTNGQDAGRCRLAFDAKGRASRGPRQESQATSSAAAAPGGWHA